MAVLMGSSRQEDPPKAPLSLSSLRTGYSAGSQVTALHGVSMQEGVQT